MTDIDTSTEAVERWCKYFEDNCPTTGEERLVAFIRALARERDGARNKALDDAAHIVKTTLSEDCSDAVVAILALKTKE